MVLATPIGRGVIRGGVKGSVEVELGPFRSTEPTSRWATCGVSKVGPTHLTATSARPTLEALRGAQTPFP